MANNPYKTTFANQFINSNSHQPHNITNFHTENTFHSMQANQSTFSSNNNSALYSSIESQNYSSYAIPRTMMILHLICLNLSQRSSIIIIKIQLKFHNLMQQKISMSIIFQPKIYNH